MQDNSHKEQGRMHGTRGALVPVWTGVAVRCPWLLTYLMNRALNAPSQCGGRFLRGPCCEDMPIRIPRNQPTSSHVQTAPHMKS